MQRLEQWPGSKGQGCQLFVPRSHWAAGPSYSWQLFWKLLCSSRGHAVWHRGEARRRGSGISPLSIMTTCVTQKARLFPSSFSVLQKSTVTLLQSDTDLRCSAIHLMMPRPLDLPFHEPGDHQRHLQMSLLSFLRTSLELKLPQNFPRNVCSKSRQSCPTLCDPMDCSLPDSSVYGILQARILEWVAMSSSWPREWTHIFYDLLHWQTGSLPLVPEISQESPS